MGVLDLLGLGQSAAAPIEAIGNVIGKVYTSEGEKLSAQEMLERLRQNPQMWAAEVNKLDAASQWKYQAGWRPTFGYVCSAALAWTYVFQPIVVFILTAFHVTIPPIDNNIQDLMPIIYGILGLGGLRSFEKIKKV